jgi:plasmid stabilization system protein ParE
MSASPQRREARSELPGDARLPPTLASGEAAAPQGQPDPAAAPPETLYLTGRPSLKRFIRYVRGHAVDQPPEADLAEEWQAAKRVVDTLEKEEAGLADGPALGKLGPEYQPLLIEFLKDPLVRGGFNSVPTEVALVELDRLVVYQKHIDVTYAGQLARHLGRAPSRAQIFQTCLGHDHPQPPVKWSRVHGDSFVFVSASNDLRFLGSMSLQQKQIVDHAPPGNVAGIIGLAVGFGSNFLNAIYAENRLVLSNGSHRAYTLRSLGVTHAPCIVQHVSSREELDLVAPSPVQSNPDRYLRHPRPMLLRDYFDPRLHKVMPFHRRLQQVTVRFEVEENFLPAL